MLPDSMSEHGYPLLVLIGLMTVFVVEKLVFGQNQPGTHSLIGLTAFFGLSIHAFIAGFSFSFILLKPIIPVGLISSLLIHKMSETFALASVFLLAGYSKRKSIKLILVFSMFTPIAVLLGLVLVKTVASDYIGAAAAIATGTFLYVAIVDLLPEVFHHNKGKWWNLSALLLGIAIIAAIIGTSNFAH
jgi:zinc transporter ZupT